MNWQLQVATIYSLFHGKYSLDKKYLILMISALLFYFQILKIEIYNNTFSNSIALPQNHLIIYRFACTNLNTFYGESKYNNENCNPNK